jgi:hypothetical protein
MALTALDYKKAVRRKLGLGDTDTTALPDDDTLAAINDALKVISMEWEWYWLFATATASTVAGTATIAAPAGYLRTISLDIGGDIMVERTFAELFSYETTSGTPSIFALAGANLRLWPTPSAVQTYTLYYYRSEPALTLDADTPLLPDAYSPWLVAEAALALALRTNSTDKYSILQEEVAGWRRRAVGDMKRKRNAAPRRIGRTKESVWSAPWSRV